MKASKWRLLKDMLGWKVKVIVVGLVESAWQGFDLSAAETCIERKEGENVDILVDNSNCYQNNLKTKKKKTWLMV